LGTHTKIELIFPVDLTNFTTAKGEIFQTAGSPAEIRQVADQTFRPSEIRNQTFRQSEATDP
jgi:hypothetical protein